MTPKLIKVVEVARDHQGRFLVRAPDQDWQPFHDIEDALVDVSLELGERGILVHREHNDRTLPRISMSLPDPDPVDFADKIAAAVKKRILSLMAEKPPEGVIETNDDPDPRS